MGHLWRTVGRWRWGKVVVEDYTKWWSEDYRKGTGLVGYVAARRYRVRTRVSERTSLPDAGGTVSEHSARLSDGTRRNGRANRVSRGSC